MRLRTTSSIQTIGASWHDICVEVGQLLVLLAQAHRQGNRKDRYVLRLELSVVLSYRDACRKGSPDSLARTTNRRR